MCEGDRFPQLWLWRNLAVPPQLRLIQMSGAAARRHQLIGRPGGRQGNIRSPHPFYRRHRAHPEDKVNDRNKRNAVWIIGAVIAALVIAGIYTFVVGSNAPAG